MRKPILNHTKRGELVYEPFLGGGTTLAAAELSERVCVGIELDTKYVDVAVQRWQSLAHKVHNNPQLFRCLWVGHGRQMHPCWVRSSVLPYCAGWGAGSFRRS
jgi:hypothetical protein